MILDGKIERGNLLWEPMFYETYHDEFDRLWLVGQCLNPGDHIYQAARVEENALGWTGPRGHDGAVVTFNLGHGSKIMLTGPWRRNAERFYQATEVDVRDKHLTYGVIGTSLEPGCEGSRYAKQMLGVIYNDGTPQVGTLSRIMDLAHELAYNHGCNLMVYDENWTFTAIYKTSIAFC